MSEYDELIRAFERIHGLDSGDLVVQDEVLDSRVEGSSPEVGERREEEVVEQGWGASPIVARGEHPRDGRSVGHLPAFASSRLGVSFGEDVKFADQAAADRKPARDFYDVTASHRYHGGPERGAEPGVGTPGGSATRVRPEAQWNLGVGPEWRLTNTKQDTLVVRALEEITSKLQSLTPASSDPEMEFSGRPAEDPGRFMEALEEWLGTNNVPERRWTAVLRRCLKGEAYKWFADLQTTEWHLIGTLFGQRWDSEAMRGNLWRQLFGEPQRPDERVVPFIMAKWGLCQRLVPEMSDAKKVGMIKELLIPGVRAYCRTMDLSTLEALLEFTIQIERDLLDGGGPSRATPRSEASGRRTDQRPGTAAQPRPSVGPQNSTQRRDPYPCRWCGSVRHFNNLCPHRPVYESRGPPQPNSPTQQQQGRQEQQPRNVQGATTGNGTRAPATAPAQR